MSEGRSIAATCIQCRRLIAGELIETVEGPVGYCCALPHEDDLRRSELEMILNMNEDTHERD